MRTGGFAAALDHIGAGIRGGIGVVLAMSAAAPALAQQFEIRFDTPLIAGQAPEITLTGLAPGAEVEVMATRALVNRWEYGRSPKTYTYEAKARFRADGEGKVDFATSPALSGSFTGVDPSGLFWSMQAAGEAPKTATQAVTLEAMVDGRSVATAAFDWLEQPPGFTIEEVSEFPGSYFAPHPTGEARPVIILVEGADNNAASREEMMPRLVARGFSVFHFATYALVYGPARPAAEGLPTTYVNIPIDPLQDVHDWLAARPEADAARIGLYGFSRGSAHSLLAATRFDWVRAVAAIAPSDVVWEGWGDGVPMGVTSSYPLSLRF